MVFINSGEERDECLGGNVRKLSSLHNLFLRLDQMQVFHVAGGFFTS